MLKTLAKEVKERHKILITPKFNCLEKHETLSKNFAINNKRKDTYTKETSTETISSCYKLIGQCHMMLNYLHPQLLLRQFFNPTILCPTENTLVIGSIGQSDFQEVATITSQADCTHP